MANVIDGGSADKWCRENMGKGISIVYGRPQEKPASREPGRTSGSVSQEWSDQIAVEVWEAMHNQVMTAEKAVELGIKLPHDDRDEQPMKHQTTEVQIEK